MVYGAFYFLGIRAHSFTVITTSLVEKFSFCGGDLPCKNLAFSLFFYLPFHSQCQHVSRLGSLEEGPWDHDPRHYLVP